MPKSKTEKPSIYSAIRSDVHGVEVKPRSKKPLRFEYWQTAKKEWYWHLVAKNGKIVAVGGEGYKRRSGVLNAFHAIFDFEVSPIITQIFPDKPKVRPYEGKLNRNWP